MNRERVMDMLINDLMAVQRTASSIELYVFGSSLGHSYINDIDLLVVYRDSDNLRKVKSMLCDIGLRVPLDVTIMTEREEKQTNFIRGQGAIKLS